MYERFFTGKRVKAALATYIDLQSYSHDDFNSFLHNIYFDYAIAEAAIQIDKFAKDGSSNAMLEKMEILLCNRFIDRIRSNLLQAEFHSLKKTGKSFTQDDVNELCDIFQTFIIENRPNPINKD